jgi:hypothetical protein
MITGCPAELSKESGSQLPAPPPARRPEPYGSESRDYSLASGSASSP